MIGGMVCVVAAAAMLSACTVTLDPVTGDPVVGADPAAIEAITAEVLEQINDELARPGK